MVLSAQLLETATGRPVVGQPIVFQLGGPGGQSVTATTGADGGAATTLLPALTPGAASLSLTFAGGGGYAGSAAALLLPILRDETAILYIGKAGFAAGGPATGTARLTDGEKGTPIAGRQVTFTFGATTATGITATECAGWKLRLLCWPLPASC